MEMCMRVFMLGLHARLRLVQSHKSGRDMTANKKRQWYHLRSLIDYRNRSCDFEWVRLIADLAL